MILLNRIQDKNTKFLAVMVIVIISAMMITYGLSNILGSYFNTVDSVYMGVQLNLWITIGVIAIITIVMLIMLPKQTIDDLFRDISGGNGHGAGIMSIGNNNNERTDEQQLQDMIDEELDSNKK